MTNNIKIFCKYFYNMFFNYNLLNVYPRYMHPRSSISKTPLRLANSTGIVDSGYRGPLIGMFDCITPQYVVERFDRLIQVCAPGLMPIFVELVDRLEDLGAETVRGEGGIGSTGR